MISNFDYMISDLKGDLGHFGYFTEGTDGDLIS
jgi:hypothetical protein